MSREKQLQQFGEVVLGALKRQFQVSKPVTEFEFNWDKNRNILTLNGDHGSKNIAINVTLAPGNVSAVGRFTLFIKDGTLTYNTSGTYAVSAFSGLHAYLNDTKVEEKKEVKVVPNLTKGDRKRAEAEARKQVAEAETLKAKGAEVAPVVAVETAPVVTTDVVNEAEVAPVVVEAAVEVIVDTTTVENGGYDDEPV